MKKTEKAILEATVNLYNLKGITGVRSQDIATEVDISLSNLNYHFKSKEDLATETFKLFFADLDNILSTYSKEVVKGKGMEMIKEYIDFQFKYRFFYLESNYILKNYPEIKAEFENRKIIGKGIVENIFYSAIGKGYLVLEQRGKTTQEIIENIWNKLFFVNFYFIQYLAILGNLEDYFDQSLRAIFEVIRPYIVPKENNHLQKCFEMM